MKIKDLREKNGLTQKELASLLDIPANTLSQYENNKREPGSAFLKRVATYFNVSTDYIIEYTNNIQCPICNYSYDPLSPQEEENHMNHHREFQKHQQIYQAKLCNDSAFSKRIFAYAQYLSKLSEENLSKVYEYTKKTYEIQQLEEEQLSILNNTRKYQDIHSYKDT